MTDLSVVICLALDHRSSSEGLTKFKACISRCPYVETTLEVTGAFDLIVHGRCASLAEYSQQMNMLRPQLSEFVTRFETNFVCNRIDKQCGDHEQAAIWLPCEGGHKRIAVNLIDKIVAEGDYMRVHVGDWDCLIHSTMHRLCEQLEGSQFIQLHRSTIVRMAFIERFIHDEHGWNARLRDGTLVKIAKSHVKEALQLAHGDSSKPEGGSPKSAIVTDVQRHVNEIPAPA